MGRSLAHWPSYRWRKPPAQLRNVTVTADVSDLELLVQIRSFRTQSNTGRQARLCRLYEKLSWVSFPGSYADATDEAMKDANDKQPYRQWRNWLRRAARSAPQLPSKLRIRALFCWIMHLPKPRYWYSRGRSPDKFASDSLRLNCAAPGPVDDATDQRRSTG